MIDRPDPSRFSHVLLYHATFSEVPERLGTNLHNVPPEALHKQLSWMRQHFDMVRLDDLLTMENREGTFAVTFDDAYKSVFEEALPVLEDLRIPACVFVIGSTLSGAVFWRDKVRLLTRGGMVPDFVDWAQPYCDENRITAENFYKRSKAPSVNSREFDRFLDAFAESEAGGWQSGDRQCVDDPEQLIDHPLLTYGNHTYSHYVLSSLSDEEKAAELKQNAELIESLDLKRSQVFSLPFGGPETYDAQTLGLVNACGYRAALLSRNRINRNAAEPLPRLHGLPVIERYMPQSAFSGFLSQVAELERP
ncbi:polysaccharide deacetylase family protein [Roseibium sp. RKSG952]|uniref:polysaccharide deacetylase family protein n=1 Tax=Roseibium sp. RKSG952 TaxID=2529384 RepID=UPI0012BD5CE4|nr:polysaccharide deacetylase family protein [Roseibium sp. RKSG952]MTH96811.1 hypothetical protein [Roseibium sp. RKSG952]